MVLCIQDPTKAQKEEEFTLSSSVQLSLSSRGPAWLQSDPGSARSYGDWEFARNWGDDESLVAKTKTFIINEPLDSFEQLEKDSINTTFASLPRAYSIQHLRSQAIELVASKEALQDGATSDRRAVPLNEIQERSLFDVTTVSKRGRQLEEESSDTLLLVHVDGINKTQLIATVLSAPKFARQNNESAFANYDYYLSSATSSRPVTPGILREHARQRDEVYAEQGLLFGDDDEEEAERRDSLLSKRVVLHTFPSRICSVQFGQASHSAGILHRGPWISVRTISSTLFASVEVTTKKERLLGHSELRLVSLLEIMHGNSILPSGIQSKRHLAKGKIDEKMKFSKSEYPIVDVQFHPERATEAVTVDSVGNIGLFTCDLFKLTYTTWSNCVDWSMKEMPEQDNEGVEIKEGIWMIQWAEKDTSVVLASQRSLWVVSLDDIKQRKLFTCPEDASISCLARSEAPDSLLWVATTRNILLFDLRSESQYKSLLSWEHNRNHGEKLQMIATAGMRHANALLISNPFDRFLNMYIAKLSPSGLEATTRGEPRQVQSSLDGKRGYASGSRFIQVNDLHKSWQRWIRRVSWDRRVGHENEKVMIEMGSNGCITLKIVTWSYSDAISKLHGAKSSLPTKKQADYTEGRKTCTNLDAERTLHSFSTLYRILIGSREEADLEEYNEALTNLAKASRWLQEQDSPNDTLLLPHDILAICNSEGSEVLESALFRLPLLPPKNLKDAELKRFVTRFMSSIHTDAYVLEVGKILQEIIVAPILLGEDLENQMEKFSSVLAQKYLPDDNPSQSAAQQAGIVKLEERLLESCREINWDILLSSRIVSMRPVIVEQHNDHVVAQDEGRSEVDISTSRRNQSLIDFSSKAPSFSFGFFTPRLPLLAVSKRGKNRQSNTILTEAARYLLSEWKVGEDPQDYHFQHPYRDAEEIMSGSEDFYSQSDTDQRGSRQRSLSSRSVSASQFDQGSTPSQVFSQPLPPIIASQSTFTHGGNAVNSRMNPPIFNSQPVILNSSSVQRQRPRKRRIGGF